MRRAKVAGRSGTNRPLATVQLDGGAAGSARRPRARRTDSSISRRASSDS